MDGYRAYKYYMSIKLHFTSDKYDVFKVNGRVKGTREAFNSRNDRYMFEKLARKFSSDKELIQYYVSNFAYGNNDLIYSKEEAEENYSKWKLRKESISKIFYTDLQIILNYSYKNKLKYDNVFNFTSSKYPSIITLYLSGNISIETLVILDKLIGLTDLLKSNDNFNLLWESDIRRIEKLNRFVKYDESKISQIYEEFVEELKEI